LEKKEPLNKIGGLEKRFFLNKPPKKPFKKNGKKKKKKIPIRFDGILLTVENNSSFSGFPIWLLQGIVPLKDRTN